MLKLKDCKKFMKQCNRCGKLKLIKRFSKNGKRRKNYCSYCESEVKKKYIKICEYCGNEFKGLKTQKYCSVECMGKHKSIINVGKNNANWKNKTHHYKCDYCNKDIIITEYYDGYKNHHFCGRECYYKWKSQNLIGENNPNYKPELTQQDRDRKRNTPEYREWRNEVFKREYWTCQITGIKGTRKNRINAHHLYNYKDNKNLAIDINNGITLNRNIHILFHKLYGKNNNTKEQFEEFKIRYNIGEFDIILPYELRKFKNNKESA